MHHYYGMEPPTWKEREMVARLLTTAEAAALLGKTPRRVRQLIDSGELLGVRMGRDWFVAPASIATYEARVRRSK